MSGTKANARIKDVQEAIDEFYPDMDWVAIGSLEHNKGCSIIDAKTGVTIKIFKKNYDALSALTDKKIDLRKKVKVGLGIAKPMGLAHELTSCIRKLITEAKVFMKLTGGIRPRFIYKNNVPVDVKLTGVDKEI